MAARRSALLDGLRFLASALIVVYHYCSEGPTPLETVHPIFLRGYLATDFFLILSGYVLGRAYGGQVSAGTISDEVFLFRRVKRIWPGHLMVLAGFVAVILAAQLAHVPAHHAEHFRWSALGAQALLIHAWGPFNGGGWNMPSWSLSALVICYAAFPSIWRRLGLARGGGVLFAGALGAILIADLGSRLVLKHGFYDLPFQLGVVRALPLFLFGACAARAAELGWLANARPGWIAAGAGLGVVALQFVGRFDFVSIALLGLLIVSAGETRAQRGGKLMSAAAQLSFALYITHILTSLLWFTAERALEARVALPLAVRWALWAASFPVALAVAYVFDQLFDQPVQRLLARLKWPGAGATPKVGPPGATQA